MRSSPNDEYLLIEIRIPPPILIVQAKWTAEGGKECFAPTPLLGTAVEVSKLSYKCGPSVSVFTGRTFAPQPACSGVWKVATTIPNHQHQFLRKSMGVKNM